jgi:hypothetical protein
MYLSQLAAKLQPGGQIWLKVEEKTNGNGEVKTFATLFFQQFKEDFTPSTKLEETIQFLNPTDEAECSRFIDFLAQRIFNRL